MKPDASVFATLALVSVPLCQYAQGTSQQQPNIVLIMCDDMGYSDLGCYGSEIRTPHIDSLAVNGLRFSHFLNTGRSCPSRASLLTGHYQHDVGMGWMTAGTSPRLSWASLPRSPDHCRKNERGRLYDIHGRQMAFDP